MPTLFFPDLESFRRTLGSGAVAATIVHGPAQGGFDDAGRLWLTTEALLPRETQALLSRYGVQVVGSRGDVPAQPLCCWHQILPLQRQPEQTPAEPWTSVLFDVPWPRLPRLMAEIHRLSAARLAIRQFDCSDDSQADPRALVRVEHPPFHTLTEVLLHETTSAAASLDDSQTIHAYVEQAPRVWVQVGYRHPLASLIVPPEGRCYLLRPPTQWLWLDDRPFTPECDLFALPGREASLRDIDQSTLLDRSMPMHRSPPIERSTPFDPSISFDRAMPFELPVQLVREKTPAVPELWLLRGIAREELLRLARSLDERLLQRLLIAVGQFQGRECFLLRIQTGKHPPPQLVLDAEAFTPILKLSNLYLPSGWRLRPRIRRDVLRQLLAAEAKHIVWLRAGDDGRLQRHALPESAFRPLLEWITFQVESATRPQRAWTGSDPFAPLPLHCSEPESVAASLPERLRSRNENSTATAGTTTTTTAAPATTPTTAPAMRRPGVLLSAWWQRLAGWLFGWWHRPSAEPVEASPAVPRVSIEEAIRNALRSTEERPPTTEETAPRSTDAQERHAQLEKQLLNGLSHCNEQQSASIWPELAASYERANNPSDAAICWLNALWAESSSMSLLWAWGLLRAEAKSTRWNIHEVDLPLWLRMPATPAHARTLAAYLIWASLQKSIPHELQTHLCAVQTYLAQHEAWLPVRLAWLAAVRTAHLSQGDVLGLARCRDRLMERLRTQGVSLDIDTPSFLRFSSLQGGERFQTVRERLVQWRELIHRWISRLHQAGRIGDTSESSVYTGSRLNQFGLDVEVPFTKIYADLILSWGLARLGEFHSSNNLLQQAQRTLREADEVHQFLAEAFTFRIRQVQDGKPHHGSLPAELLARLDGMHEDVRYKINKLREYSRILEPADRSSAYRKPNSYTGFDDLGTTLVGLPDIHDPRVLSETVQRLVENANRSGEWANLPRVVLAVLDVVPRLPELIAKSLVEQVPLALQQIRPHETVLRLKLLEKSLRVAGYLQQAELALELVQHFVQAIEGKSGLSALKEFEGLTGETFRSLRRLGLRTEVERLLQRMAEWVTQGQDLAILQQRQPAYWPVALRTLLHLASGWFYCAQDDLAIEVLDKAREQLFMGQLPPNEQTSLALTYAQTLGQTPVRLALGRLQELFERLRNIRVGGFTSSHFTLQALELIETVVWAVVHEDFSLGPIIRSWLDDDEYLIRKRIHRDLTQLLHGSP